VSRNKWINLTTYTHDLWAVHFSRITSDVLIIDATLGNGHDAKQLMHLVKRYSIHAELHVYDIQQNPIDDFKTYCEESFSTTQSVNCIKGCHSLIGDYIFQSSLPLYFVCYNLGYLPGGDKSVTTKVETTFKSVEQAIQSLASGGVLSCTIYTGHEHGRIEYNALSDYFFNLDNKLFSVFHTCCGDKSNAPQLFWITKR
jgi:hypothetical protein